MSEKKQRRLLIVRNDDTAETVKARDEFAEAQSALAAEAEKNGSAGELQRTSDGGVVMDASIIDKLVKHAGGMKAFPKSKSNPKSNPKSKSNQQSNSKKEPAMTTTTTIKSTKSTKSTTAKKAEPKKVESKHEKASPAKRTHAHSCAAVARALIWAGKSNDEVWAVISKQFKLGDNKRHYPSWYRCQIRREDIKQPAKSKK